MTTTNETDYLRWRIARWPTPVSDIRAVAMASLIDDGTLRITLEATRLVPRERWCISFERYAGYRNIMEEYRLELWRHLDESRQRCGNTFTVEDSSWIAEISRDEPLLLVHMKGLQHYVITTEDDVIEVLSPGPPDVIALGAVDTSVPVAGKSQVLYHPEDSTEIEKLKKELLGLKEHDGGNG